MRLAMLGLLGLAACVPAHDASDPEIGALSFQANCAVCHGEDGRGAGRMSRDLLTLPPDLTGLSARNGGEFPAAYVLGVVEGHAREPQFSGAMPEFTGSGMGAGPMVQVEGAERPVSAPMAGLLAYLKGIQL